MKNHRIEWLPPVHVYDGSCWPWWARWCVWTRRWYSRKHPELFNTEKLFK